MDGYFLTATFYNDYDSNAHIKLIKNQNIRQPTGPKISSSILQVVPIYKQPCHAIQLDGTSLSLVAASKNFTRLSWSLTSQTCWIFASNNKGQFIITTHPNNSTSLILAYDDHHNLKLQKYNKTSVSGNHLWNLIVPK